MDGWASLKLFELAGGSAGGEDERLFGTTEPGEPKRAITAAAERASTHGPGDTLRPPRPPGIIPEGDCGPWIVYMHYNANGGGSLSFKLTLKRKFVLGPCAKLTETCAQVGLALVSVPHCHQYITSVRACQSLAARGINAPDGTRVDARSLRLCLEGHDAKEEFIPDETIVKDVLDFSADATHFTVTMERPKPSPPEEAELVEVRSRPVSGTPNAHS